MKTTMKAFTLLAGTFFASSALSAELVCDVYPKGNTTNHTWGNGTSHCDGIDMSFGNSTSGRFYLKNVTKPIKEVQWSGSARCSGGTSCNVTIRAYAGASASALILYKDGTWERTNTAYATYETGY
ncbi:hypothetical protein [Pseudoalteromonas umbrosa]|uniref:hypothetical protein n=1 Tax=Pseudoalteromonas umbrosa TaxID=3048489 RepID=UPI0024C3F51D|nr:hypothetical protein [Pseudoalteromonas sp. B95]MDK1285747.1 hypothetical protein [Pseudoalteromonas sp. B95]